MADPSGDKRQWTYTPDFRVITNDDLIDFHEVKGKPERKDDYILKSSASQYPEFGWVMIRKVGGEWVETWFS